MSIVQTWLLGSKNDQPWKQKWSIHWGGPISEVKKINVKKMIWIIYSGERLLTFTIAVFDELYFLNKYVFLAVRHCEFLKKDRKIHLFYSQESKNICLSWYTNNKMAYCLLELSGLY